MNKNEVSMVNKIPLRIQSVSPVNKQVLHHEKASSLSNRHVSRKEAFVLARNNGPTTSAEIGERKLSRETAQHKDQRKKSFDTSTTQRQNQTEEPSSSKVRHDQNVGTKKTGGSTTAISINHRRTALKTDKQEGRMGNGKVHCNAENTLVLQKIHGKHKDKTSTPAKRHNETMGMKTFSDGLEYCEKEVASRSRRYKNGRSDATRRNMKNRKTGKRKGHGNTRTKYEKEQVPVDLSVRNNDKEVPSREKIGGHPKDDEITDGVPRKVETLSLVGWKNAAKKVTGGSNSQEKEGERMSARNVHDENKTSMSSKQHAGNTFGRPTTQDKDPSSIRKHSRKREDLKGTEKASLVSKNVKVDGEKEPGSLILPEQGALSSTEPKFAKKPISEAKARLIRNSDIPTLTLDDASGKQLVASSTEAGSNEHCCHPSDDGNSPLPKSLTGKGSSKSGGIKTLPCGTPSSRSRKSGSIKFSPMQSIKNKLTKVFRRGSSPQDDDKESEQSSIFTSNKNKNLPGNDIDEESFLAPSIDSSLLNDEMGKHSISKGSGSNKRKKETGNSISSRKSSVHSSHKCAQADAKPSGKTRTNNYGKHPSTKSVSSSRRNGTREQSLYATNAETQSAQKPRAEKNFHIFQEHTAMSILDELTSDTDSSKSPSVKTGGYEVVVESPELPHRQRHSKLPQKVFRHHWGMYKKPPIFNSLTSGHRWRHTPPHEVYRELHPDLLTAPSERIGPAQDRYNAEAKQSRRNVVRNNSENFRKQRHPTDHLPFYMSPANHGLLEFLKLF